MPDRFAAQTTVPVGRSKEEIESLLSRAGATQFVCGWDDGNRAAVQFVLNKRMIRFVLPLPDKAAKEFRMTHSGRKIRTTDAANRLWEQACRSRWRALLLVIKAKLEAVGCGISTIEHEFLAWMVTATGQTIGERLLPDLDTTLAKGPMLLLGNGGRSDA